MFLRSNVFHRPLLAELDDSGRGAVLHGAHVPAVCYADDLCLLSCNAKHLGHLLSIVEKFADDWRLEFTSPEPSKTKSHCIIFGHKDLADSPSWFLAGHSLRVVSETEHLGIVISSDLKTHQHVAQRKKRARGSFYALAPAGMFSKELSPLDKMFLWRTIVAPSLVFGSVVAPFQPEDVSEMEHLQARLLKAALGLPPQAHHSALLVALGVPSVQETHRAWILRVFHNVFKSEHRLSMAMTRGIGMLAVDPSKLGGSFLGQVYAICNSRLGNVISLSSGYIEKSMICPPFESDGVTDSLRFLAARSDGMSRRLLRLIVMPCQ